MNHNTYRLIQLLAICATLIALTLLTRHDDSPPAQTRITEDDPRWDCQAMGKSDMRPNSRTGDNLLRLRHDPQLHPSPERGAGTITCDDFEVEGEVICVDGLTGEVCPTDHRPSPACEDAIEDQVDEEVWE